MGREQGNCQEIGWADHKGLPRDSFRRTHGEDISISSLTENEIEVPKREMKALFFFRKFSGKKEYSDVKFFENQPRIEGLWVRITFCDNEMIEGIVSNSRRLLLDDTFYLKPTDPNSNNQLVCVSRPP